MISLKKIPHFTAILSCAFSNLLYADETGAPSKLIGKTASSVDIWQWLFALAIVLGIFFTCVWLLRKSGNLGLNRSELSLIAGLPLGMREKLVLVKVGEKQLLLGVTSGRIEKLLELEGAERLFLNQDSHPDLGSFQQNLMKFMQSKNHV
jgi:flagellar protein FliO/FliZ